VNAVKEGQRSEADAAFAGSQRPSAGKAKSTNGSGVRTEATERRPGVVSVAAAEAKRSGMPKTTRSEPRAEPDKNSKARKAVHRSVSTRAKRVGL
jgi:hypothetical protein